MVIHVYMQESRIPQRNCETEELISHFIMKWYLVISHYGNKKMQVYSLQTVFFIITYLPQLFSVCHSVCKLIRQ